MKKIIILGLAAVAMLATSCQQNSYRIRGEVKDIPDGDTLFLTQDLNDGTPTDTIIVKRGKFSISGPVDSTYLCMVYWKNNPEASVSFFIEPGNIHINMNSRPGFSRVSGTQINNEWQNMNDTLIFMGNQMQDIATKAYTEGMAPEEQEAAQAKIAELSMLMNGKIISTLEKNIDNELGFFLLTNFQDEALGNAKRRELISKMPEAMRQRPVIKEMENMLKDAANTEKGGTIKDFSLPAPDGQPVSAMSIIGKNRLTILDFWASWCAPCMQMMPHMKDLYGKYHEKGLEILGISLDSDHEAWEDAIKKNGMAWPQMSDLKGWENEVARTFQVTAIPHVVIVDQKGVVLERGLRSDELEQFISSKLK